MSTLRSSPSPSIQTEDISFIMCLQSVALSVLPPSPLSFQPHYSHVISLWKTKPAILPPELGWRSRLGPPVKLTSDFLPSPKDRVHCFPAPGSSQHLSSVLYHGFCGFISKWKWPNSSWHQWGLSYEQVQSFSCGPKPQTNQFEEKPVGFSQATSELFLT